MLSDKFFPNPETITLIVVKPIFLIYSINLKFKILQKVNITDIKKVLSKTGAFKALK